MKNLLVDTCDCLMKVVFMTGLTSSKSSNAILEESYPGYVTVNYLKKKKKMKC